MTTKNCSCWKVLECRTSGDCPDKCEPGKTCWETSFFHNHWQKVFEKCRHCKVFHSNAEKMINAEK